jgi:hypothetical protein
VRALALTYTATRQLRNGTRGGFGWEVAHEAVSRRPPISLYTMVPRAHIYTYGAEVWALSIVKGFHFLSPRTEPFTLRFAFPLLSLRSDLVPAFRQVPTHAAREAMRRRLLDGLQVGAVGSSASNTTYTDRAVEIEGELFRQSQEGARAMSFESNGNRLVSALYSHDQLRLSLIGGWLPAAAFIRITSQELAANYT